MNSPKTLPLLLLALTSLLPLHIHAQLQVRELYPESSGFSIGLGYLQTEDEIHSVETNQGVLTDITQSDDIDFLALSLGLTRNETWYFKVGGAFGISIDGSQTTRGDSTFRGESISQDDSLSHDSGILFDAGARLGYNVDLTPAFRVRPVLGYKLHHKRFSTTRTFEFPEQDESFRRTVNYEHTWHGFTYGIEADLHLGNSILFAGIDFFEASPDLDIRGPAAMEPSVSRSWDGDGTEFHLGILHEFDRGILFLRAFHQSWSADGSGRFPPPEENGGDSTGTGEYDWDLSNTGVMLGMGFGF